MATSETILGRQGPSGVAANRTALLLAFFALGRVRADPGWGSFAGAGIWPILSAVMGVSMVVSVIAFASVHWLGQRRLCRDVAIFAALYGDADDSTFLVDDATMRLVWQNRQATTTDAARCMDPPPCFWPISRPIPTVWQCECMKKRRHRQGRSFCRLGRADWRLRVRPAGHGRMLWQISATRHADPRDALPFRMVQTEEGGRIVYLSPGLLTEGAPPHAGCRTSLSSPFPKPARLARWSSASPGSAIGAFGCPRLTARIP